MKINPENFDRVSGLHDNGSPPLQGQEDEQPVEVTTPENAIDDDDRDMRTIYPPWSLATNDMCDNIQIANDKNMKDIRDEICKDTPLKTDINKPYYYIVVLELFLHPDSWILVSQMDIRYFFHNHIAKFSGRNTSVYFILKFLFPA